MTVLIQHIETYWTKISRGQPQAALRNAVPETYSVDDVPDKNGVFYLHIQYSENNSFQKPSVTAWRVINENQQRQIGLHLRLIEPNKLLVSKWMKNGFLKKVGELTPGSWLKIVSNERVVLEHTWAYKKHVFNVYFGDQREINEALLVTSPVHTMNLEIDLW